MHFRIICSVAICIIAGCATTDQTVAADPAAKICEREYRVGSNIPTRDCRPAITEEERQRSNEEMRNAIKPMPGRPVTGG